MNVFYIFFFFFFDILLYVLEMQSTVIYRKYEIKFM